MNLDTGTFNTFRILADKPEGEIVGAGAIQTADGQVHQRPGDGWPQRGITYSGGWPQAMQVSINLIASYAARGLASIEGARTVVRPSRPDPDFEGGSAAVKPEHHAGDPDNPIGNPLPHVLPQADAIVFHDPDRGDQRYKVTRNPDKYVAGDKSGTKPVTAKVYEAGKTEVDHFYTLAKES